MGTKCRNENSIELHNKIIIVFGLPLMYAWNYLFYSHKNYFHVHVCVQHFRKKFIFSPWHSQYVSAGVSASFLCFFLLFYHILLQSYGKWYLFSLKDSRQLTLLQKQIFMCIWDTFLIYLWKSKNVYVLYAMKEWKSEQIDFFSSTVEIEIFYVSFYD